ncbi:MAG: hypothetical protein CBB87_01070 [Micavibrio sp. TMED27]|nr:hypothetical protein [Micavibrio sp.]OUT92362.1 MAG: hypothetical protein CBB87_01070 [Micavibrio sp. TMED27]|tara:strand:+ start:158 stop:595 length:438 start_codon:yes stop_codon:yes gene_type:complete
MSALLNDIRREVEDIHGFFVDWFNGTASVDDIETQLIPRFDDALRFISPDGISTYKDQLILGFRQAYGSNSDFKILITDVEILHEIGDKMLISYVEWQRGKANIIGTKNGRITTALLTQGNPFRWFHVHETLLPETVSAKNFPDF